MRALTLTALFGCLLSWVAHANEPGSRPARSAGCGTLQAGTGKFLPVETRILDQHRKYHLRVPVTYDPGRAYPVVFLWHGGGGDGLSGGLGIEFSAGNDAIVVGADGLNKRWSVDTTAADLQFFDSILEAIASGYCIDRDRVFSYGYSGGGYFSNLLACKRGDVLRASAAIAGGPRGRDCKGRVAAWFLHDADDKVVPLANGIDARDRAIGLNACSTVAVDAGEGCVRYDGCNSAPVVWCESNGYGHDIRGDYAPSRVWKFFLNLR